MKMQVPIELLLDRQVDKLDKLIAAVRGGIRHQAHFDQLEEEAQSIAAALTAAFRGARR